MSMIVDLFCLQSENTQKIKLLSHLVANFDVFIDLICFHLNSHVSNYFLQVFFSNM